MPRSPRLKPQPSLHHKLTTFVTDRCHDQLSDLRDQYYSASANQISYGAIIVAMTEYFTTHPEAAAMIIAPLFHQNGNEPPATKKKRLTPRPVRSAAGLRKPA